MVITKEIRSVEMYDKGPSEEEKTKRNLDDKQREQSVAIVTDIEGNIRLDYVWHKQYPVCLDAFFITVMDTLLRKRGWRQGVKRASFKSGLRADEVLRCIAFKEAYEETFDAVVPEDNQFEELDISTEAFLGLVDERLEEKEKNRKGKNIDVSTVEELVAILTAEGFSLIYP